MKTIFHIASWEFTSRFKTRSFLFSTFFLPILFSLLITLPVFFISYEPEVSTKLIGVINLSDNSITDRLQDLLNNNFRLKNRSPEYVVLPISVENSPSYKEAFTDLNLATQRKDSITQSFNDIKALRARYYKSQNLTGREYLLNKTYKEQGYTREQKELAENEYENYKLRLDSVYNKEARISADSLLIKNVLNAYLVFPKNIIEKGTMEYHSLTPGDLLESERIQKVINEVIIHSRLAESEFESKQIAEWLEPVNLKNFQLRTKGSMEWDFYIEFYGSVIGVVLLFMAIFTSGGFLFNSVLQEKTSRVIEILLSYASSRQIMAGKIFGLGFLGLVQVIIWLLVTAIFVLFNLFQAGTISYLNLENALYFLHYFSLGYLLYASIFVTIGAVFNSEQEAQQVNIFLRSIAILPVLLVFLFLKEPNSDLITYLTYIPLLTPYFMIMKISQYNVLLTSDIYLTSLILIISIIGMVFVAAKIFRMGILMYGKKLTIKEIWLLLRSS